MAHELVYFAPVGDRLNLFLAQWQNFTADLFIILIIAQVFQINFPWVLREASVTLRDHSVLSAICQEFNSKKNAVVVIDGFPSVFLSPICVIPRRNLCAFTSRGTLSPGDCWVSSSCSSLSCTKSCHSVLKTRRESSRVW